MGDASAQGEAEDVLHDWDEALPAVDTVAPRVGTQLRAADFGLRFSELEKLMPSSSVAQTVTGANFGLPVLGVNLAAPSLQYQNSIVAMAREMTKPGGALDQASVAARSMQYQNSIVAMARDMTKPGGALDQASVAARSLSTNASSLVSQLAAQLASPDIHRMLSMRLPEFLDSNYTGVLARAAALESEFANPTTGVAAGFGMLHERISSSPRLSAEVAGFAKVAAAPPTGAMKIPVKDLHQRVQRIQDALEDDHALREQLELPLSEVQAISGTDRWDTVNVSALIGFGNWVRGVNGIALACGVTAGVARFLIGAGAGSPVELATWEGVASGAAVYLFISSRQGARGRA